MLYKEAKRLIRSDNGVLVFDDRTLDKPYSHQIERVTRHWSGKHHRIVQGINLISTIWTEDSAIVLVDFRIYCPDKDAKNKNDHLRDMLREADERMFQPGIYSRDAKSNRNQYRIHSLRKFFISQLSLWGARTLAEHLSGHMGYLDASYRQVSPEFAASEYKKLDEVLTVCIPEPVKKEIKDLKAGYANLTETTTLQGESIEGYRRITADLKKQQAEQQKAIDALSKLVQSLVEDKEHRQGRINQSVPEITVEPMDTEHPLIKKRSRK